MKENTEFHKIGTLNEIMEAFNECAKQLEEKDKEIERLKDEYIMLQNASDEVEEDLQQRIDKAIEYLQNNDNREKRGFEPYWYSVNADKVLEILQGSNKGE